MEQAAGFASPHVKTFLTNLFNFSYGCPNQLYFPIERKHAFCYNKLKIRR